MGFSDLSRNTILESIIDRNPFFFEIIDNCVSSALIPGLILFEPIASLRKAHIDPSKIGVESILDSDTRILLKF
mgnify:CR=1 FL=1